MSEQSDEIILVTKGEEAIFSIFLEKTTLPRPVDLTTFDEFKLCVISESGTPLELTETANANGSLIEKVAPDNLGQLRVTIKPADTLLLAVSFGQDIDIEWGIAASPTTPKRKRLHKILNVEDSCIS